MHKISDAMCRMWGRFGSDIEHWAQLMASARNSTLPIVRADRLRAAAEVRAMMRDRA